MSSKAVILWAEDDDNDALLMERALRRAGVFTSLIRVSDGVQAAEYLSGQGRYSDRRQYPIPDLLLLDIKMPRMSGFEVLEWKQSRAQWRELPAVILSSSTDERDRVEASRLGAKAYFVKPSSFETLVREVQAITAELLGVPAHPSCS